MLDGVVPPPGLTRLSPGSDPPFGARRAAGRLRTRWSSRPGRNVDVFRPPHLPGRPDRDRDRNRPAGPGHRRRRRPGATASPSSAPAPRPTRRLVWTTLAAARPRQRRRDRAALLRPRRPRLLPRRRYRSRDRRRRRADADLPRRHHLLTPATGAHAIHGLILARYQALGGPSSLAGFPTSDEQTGSHHRGRGGASGGLSPFTACPRGSTGRPKRPPC